MKKIGDFDPFCAGLARHEKKMLRPLIPDTFNCRIALNIRKTKTL
jgi:hypothetical protein